MWAREDTEALLEIWHKVYLFILEVRDLQPNLGMYWYFFTEIFTQFRTFFVFVFHFQVRCMADLILLPVLFARRLED